MANIVPGAFYQARKKALGTRLVFGPSLVKGGTWRFLSFTKDQSLTHFRISQGIDEELSLAAEAFLEGEDGCVLNMPKREVNLSVVE